MEPLRKAILDRDGWACQHCGVAFRELCARFGRERAAFKIVVHHIVPRSVGGTDETSNLLTLCASCHGKEHGRMNREALRAAMARG